MTHSGIENLDEEKLTAVSDLLLSLAKSIDPPRLLLDLSLTRFFGSVMLGVIFRVWISSLEARRFDGHVLCSRRRTGRLESHQSRATVDVVRHSGRRLKGLNE